MTIGDLHTFKYDLELKESIGYVELKDYLDFYKNMKFIDKKENFKELSNILWEICTNFKFNDDELLKIGEEGEFLSTIEDFAAYLADPSIKEFMEKEKSFYEEKGVAFILFLRNLANFEEYYSQNKERFMDFYGKLHDVMQSIKWIFQLKKTDKKIFPIHKLLDSVITDFTPDEEHFLQLVFSLQIFSQVENLAASQNTKDKILKIAEEFNVKILNMLCNGGDLLVPDSAGISCARNGTLIAVEGHDILIRNTNEEYFSNGVNIQREYDANHDNPIAFFIIKKLERNYKLTSFEDIIKGDNYLCKQKLLEAALEQKQFNIFLPKMIIVEQNTGSFVDFLNPSGCNDSHIIISKSKSEDSNFEMFLKSIAISQNGIRCAPIKLSPDYKNIITLDFIVEFYRDVVKESDSQYINKLQSFSEDDFYQNQIFKEYFNSIKEKDGGQIDKAIEKYFSFIKAHLDYKSINEFDTISKKNKIIMPYEILVPFDGDEVELYKYILNNEYIPLSEKYSLEDMIVKREYSNKYSYSINDLDVSKAKFYDISENEITDLPKKQCKVFFSKELNQIFLLDEFNNTIKRLNELIELQEMSVLKNDFISKHNKINVIASLVKNIEFDERVYKHYGSQWNCCTNISIVYFKIFWHMQVYGLRQDRYEKFEKLILEKYYTKFTLNAKSMIDQYIENVRQASKSNCLIIAKESSGDATTLTNIIEKNICGEREPIKMAFSSEKLASEITVEGEDKYYFLDEEIKEIIFLTDNILSGSSTGKMLNYYLFDRIDCREKRTFLNLPEGKKISDIFIKNRPQISIYTIFCSESGKERLIEDFKEQALFIREEDLIPKDKYHWTQEVEDIICELYGMGNRKIRNQKYQCVFRPYNLPHEDILPQQLKDTYNLVGIFRRKGEL